MSALSEASSQAHGFFFTWYLFILPDSVCKFQKQMAKCKPNNYEAEQDRHQSNEGLQEGSQLLPRWRSRAGDHGAPGRDPILFTSLPTARALQHLSLQSINHTGEQKLGGIEPLKDLPEVHTIAPGTVRRCRPHLGGRFSQDFCGLLHRPSFFFEVIKNKKELLTNLNIMPLVIVFCKIVMKMVSWRKFLEHFLGLLHGAPHCTRCCLQSQGDTRNKQEAFPQNTSPPRNWTARG